MNNFSVSLGGFGGTRDGGCLCSVEEIDAPSFQSSLRGIVTVAEATATSL
jgi:hypothetical protein